MASSVMISDQFLTFGNFSPMRIMSVRPQVRPRSSPELLSFAELNSVFVAALFLKLAFFGYVIYSPADAHCQRIKSKAR